MMKREWWKLTGDEVQRLTPPPNVLTVDEHGNWWRLDTYYEDWQPVGMIPRPRTRLGWLTYHLIHGFAMRYPWWKVIGFALANTKPETIVVDEEWLERNARD